ncbi:MAG: carbohydrate kinase [Bacteroidales bacterium]|nr:carbohydrate kinase [Bacteroidales bacterium]
MYLLGFDIGSSSIKVNLVDAENGNSVASDFQPREEMKITALKAGWAEQDPELWWEQLKIATHNVLIESGIDKDDIVSIGISYQMHGLVCIDKSGNVIRPSIIWCDSRAVEIGELAFSEIGKNVCLDHFLNSPGNFTASKLKWVSENEPELFRKIDKIMLPGDYIAYRLTGNKYTTQTGLSEGIMWDFKEGSIAKKLLNHYNIDPGLLCNIVPVFSNQGNLTTKTAAELGLSEKTAVAYRAGDQPNNALSLNVLNPSEIAASAGTSGVIYGISSEIRYDPQSRVNSFAHVNYSVEEPHLGVLLCVNGTGILNSWIRRISGKEMNYEIMNELAAKVPVGSENLKIIPFGNGAERLLQNKDIGASAHGLNFNIHDHGHLYRAVQEGIVFSFQYGIEIMENMGIKPSVIRAGNANMFLSPVFRETLAGITQAEIELYDTDGSKGAALGSGIGAGVFKSFSEAFMNLKKIDTVYPDEKKYNEYKNAYEIWKETLNQYAIKS